MSRMLRSIPAILVQGLRAALNAMLFRTGDQSKDFVLVLATNRPADLDPAVLDRMDEALEFPLPGPQERRHILEIYLDRYIAKAGTSEGKWSVPSCDSPVVIGFRAHPRCAKVVDLETVIVLVLMLVLMGLMMRTMTMTMIVMVMITSGF